MQKAAPKCLPEGATVSWVSCSLTRGDARGRRPGDPIKANPARWSRKAGDVSALRAPGGWDLPLKATGKEVRRDNAVSCSF